MNKFIKCLSFSIVFLLLGYASNAQERYFDERYIYTQHYIYPTLINPGATAINGFHQVFVNYRNNWASFPGSPKTFTMGFGGPVADRLGLGAQLMSDNYGALNTTKGQLAFSYTVPMETNSIGFGLTTEYIKHSLSGGEFNDMVNLSDPIIIDRLDGAEFFDASFGIYGLYQSKISYGLVFPSLISSRISEDLNTGTDREIGYIFHLGYLYRANSGDITIEPSMFIKSLMNVPTHVDLNVKMTFLEERLTGGVSYTLGADKRFGFLVGTKVDALNLYYSYNISSSEFQNYNNGSHEITVGYDIGYGKKQKEKEMME